ncbi:MAG: S1 RNA-binding domain-containing protein [Bacilli bacterium]|nr:S1 RNA-binding domain-containing protein [Bacilli bacterium]
MKTYEIGNTIKVTVSGMETYGIFVKTNDDWTGLIHISEISTKYVRNISDYVKEDEIIKAKIIDVDNDKKKLTLSIKDVPYKFRTKYHSSKIIETKLGFKTLAYKLPFWIEENLKNSKKKINSIDKQ